MAKSKRASASNAKIEKCDVAGQPRTPRVQFRTGHVHVPKSSCKDHFSVIEPQINAEGVHVWPFDVSCPVDVLFLTEDGQHSVRMNRHGYFEILFLCSGSAELSYSGPASAFQRRGSRHCGQYALPPRGVPVFDSVNHCRAFF